VIRCLLALFLAMSCVPVVLAAQGPAPYDVHVELSFAEASGDEEMRDELELQLLSELRRAGCFRAVIRVVAGDAVEHAAERETLRLNVAVSELLEETTYDTSIAERADPQAPQSLELLHTSRIQAVLQVSLEHPASGHTLRARRLRGAGAHRPLLLGEDARLTALREATIEAAQEVRRFVCKGGAKRLAKEIAAAPGP
jgi:hypothetical protein